VKRRAFITGAALVLFAAQLAGAQQAEKMYRIGFLALGPIPPNAALPASFRNALQQLGYGEGKNVTYVGRWAEVKRERLPALAAEIVALKVDVIVTLGSPATAAAKEATSRIPIVMALAGDPVGVGLIESLARPGGNITGFSDNATALSAKRLEILKEAVPTASRIAVLWNAQDQAMTLRYREIDRAAHVLGVSVQPLAVREPDDFERAFAAMDHDRPDALFMVTDALTTLNRKRVLDYAEVHRIPAMYEFATLVREGGLISYGPSIDDMYQGAAAYVDKILKGTKPGGLPVEQPTRYYFVVNLKTAKALGLTIPQSLMLRADEVIE
jgi:putative tryptophan/tyrosine transport system substrate-binding protein